MTINLIMLPIAMILLIAACGKYEKVGETLDFLKFETFDCDVVRVESGESFLCRMPGGDIEKIMLIGVSIKEGEENEAKQFSSSILRRGTLVKVEPEETIGDAYGDRPAYVFVPGGKMLNILLIRNGYAEPDPETVGDKHKKSFIEAQRDTEAQKTPD